MSTSCFAGVIRDSVPNAEAIRTRAEWQEFLHENYPWLESLGDRSSMFEAEVVCNRLAGNSMASIRSTSAKVCRSSRLTHPGEAGFVQIVLQREGQMEFLQDGGDATVRRGQAFLCDTARPFETRLSEGASFSVLTLPHAALPGWSSISKALCGVPLPDATSVIAAQGALNALLLAPVGVDTPGLSQVIQAVQSMLAASLHRCAALAGDKSRDVRRFEKLRDYILEHIDDQELGPERLAEVLHMSRRGLFLMFQQHRITPGAMIQTMRLDGCREALSDPKQLGQSITQIAGDHGFSDITTLCRAFKARFGLSPSEWRKQSLGHA